MDTLLIDGDEIPNVCLDWPVDWATQVNTQIGEAVVAPGMDGGYVANDRPYQPYIMPVAATISDEDCDDTTDSEAVAAAATQRWMEVVAACKPSQLVTLTRRLQLPPAIDGDPLQLLDVTCTARYNTITVARATVDVWSAVLEFTNMQGIWYGSEETVTEGSPTILGNTRTHNMTITLAGGTGPVTLTNETTGDTLTYDGDTGTGRTIHVLGMRVTAGSAAKFSWNRRLPFRLIPGINDLAVSSGTVSIDYQPAYL